MYISFMHREKQVKTVFYQKQPMEYLFICMGHAHMHHCLELHSHTCHIHED